LILTFVAFDQGLFGLDVELAFLDLDGRQVLLRPCNKLRDSRIKGPGKERSPKNRNVCRQIKQVNEAAAKRLIDNLLIEVEIHNRQVKLAVETIQTIHNEPGKPRRLRWKTGGK